MKGQHRCRNVKQRFNKTLSPRIRSTALSKARTPDIDNTTVLETLVKCNQEVCTTSATGSVAEDQKGVSYEIRPNNQTSILQGYRVVKRGHRADPTASRQRQAKRRRKRLYNCGEGIPDVDYESIESDEDDDRVANIAFSDLESHDARAGIYHRAVRIVAVK